MVNISANKAYYSAIMFDFSVNKAYVPGIE